MSDLIYNNLINRGFYWSWVAKHCSICKHRMLLPNWYPSGSGDWCRFRFASQGNSFEKY